MTEPYRYIRYSWWKKVDLNEVIKKFSRTFHIENYTMNRNDRELSFFKEKREEIKIKADTLNVLLSPTRAILFQKEPLPFTSKDVELRKKVLELYSRKRPTPLPIFFSDEPKFDIAK